MIQYNIPKSTLDSDIKKSKNEVQLRIKAKEKTREV